MPSEHDLGWYSDPDYDRNGELLEAPPAVDEDAECDRLMEMDREESEAA